MLKINNKKFTRGNGIDISPVMNKYLGGSVALRMAAGLHQRRQPRPVSGIRKSAKLEQHLQTEDIQRRDEVNFGAEKVAGIWVGAVLQQNLRALQVAIFDGQPEGLIDDGVPRRVA